MIWIALVALAVSAVSLGVSIHTFRHNARSDIQPVLVFTRRLGKVWHLENVGRGPAVDVLVGEMDKKGVWSRITRHYPIAAGTSIKLNWLTVAQELAVTYSDVQNRPYTTYEHGRKTKFSQENCFASWRFTHYECAPGAYKAVTDNETQVANEG